jgi:DNA-directed RNA polymerase subunit RPC12/RpoP
MHPTTTRYAFRLEDLRTWHVVEAACPYCRHRAAIDHARLGRGRPPFTRLADLEMKLRCRRCGRRRGHALSLSLRPRD